MRLFLSSGESSSDRHAAEMLRALRLELESRGEELEVFGVGGEHCRSAGMELWLHQSELKVMGITEVLGRLPQILWRLRGLREKLRAAQPDLCVVLDYPGFHFSLIKRMCHSGFLVPWVYYIPPKVWAWRSHRVEFLRRYVAQVLCILPFEESWFRERGLNVTYVGNPILDELHLAASREIARDQLQIPRHAGVAVVMPGSRSAELKQHLEPMVWAVTQRALARQDGLWMCIPTATREDAARVQARLAEMKLPPQVQLRVSVGDAPLVMQAGDWGLIKSGTSTLEAACVGLPHVIVYKVSRLSAWIFQKWVKYSGPAGLPNLILGRLEIPEVLLGDVTRVRLEQEAARLERPEEKQRQSSVFAAVRERLKVDGSPSQRAARAILELRERR